MEQPNGLIPGGGAGDAQDPSRTIALERALNGAIVAADISQSFEEYLEILDHFYAEDFEGTTDTIKEPVHGRAAVRTMLAGFLVPLHVFAEIGGVSVSIHSSPIRGDRTDETHSAWTLQLRGRDRHNLHGNVVLSRRWRLGRVVSEHHYDHRRIGEPLTFSDLRFSPDGEAQDAVSRIESDVRDAWLDLQAATTQVQVAMKHRELTQENLRLTRQRYEAGVTDNVEVVQAQDAVAASDLDYINGVFAQRRETQPRPGHRRSR